MKQINNIHIDPETTTVGEVVAGNFNTANIFRQYGLDFCCGGGVSIKKACEKKNLDTTELMEQLQKLNEHSGATDENYQAWEPAHLINHIISEHHRFVRIKTDEISFYAAKVAKVHGDRHPENLEIYKQFVALSRELMNHLNEEEREVFPLIENIYNKRLTGEQVTDEEIDELRSELEKMVTDHEGAGGVMETIRELSRNYTPPEDACTTYRILYQNLEEFEKDLHKHVHLENNILFRKAENLIGNSN